MSAQQAKTCTDCGKTLPASAEHFRQRKDGLLDIRCLVCRREKLRGKRKKEDARSLRDIEVGAVASFMTAATTGGESIPHSCEVLERMMEYFGGVSGFTSLLVKQYFDSQPGGATRTKMLDSVLRLVVKNTDQGGAKKPLGQWTDLELEAALDGRLRALAMGLQGKIIDGTLAPEETASTAALAISVEAERIPAPAAQRNAGRARRQKARGPATVRADANAGGDARLPGQ
jgi:hypothetical protein